MFGGSAAISLLSIDYSVPVKNTEIFVYKRIKAHMYRKGVKSEAKN